ncbi:unnamed protein product [Arabis nemorensis]|uniref:Ubiquitin-like protease family profile domain-containing protein n=1 Tax=Arabis nemorensis TaxID=586526 RepID=A0A565BGD2_9BRAS|nr:unnamed protein product [Arabis nemorensis]
MSIPLIEILKKKRREHKESRSGDERVEKKKVEETGEVVSLLKSLLGKVDKLGKKYEDMDKKYEGMDSRMALLENKKGKATELDAQSKVGDQGDGSKNEDRVHRSLLVQMSWTVEQQVTSHAEFPVNRVVRNLKVGAKDLRNVETPVEKKAIVEFINMTTENNEAQKSRKPAVEKKEASVEFVDMTKDVTATRKDKILQLTKNDDFGVLKYRKITLAKTQVDPFIGSSGTILIMYGEIPSPAIYGPFATVEKCKLDRLLEYVKTDLENPFDSSLAGVEFDLELMTPKEMWPVDEYGWLKTSRLPREKEEVGISSGYFILYNGRIPEFAATNKKWVEDVDILYIPHNIRKAHWVAVVVDLVKKNVKVYDSICSVYSDNYIKEMCKPYAKMILMLLKQVAPPNQRRGMSEQAWNVYMIKTISQNHQSGDCGVYTLKYIECLALGHSFDGLCYSNMFTIRLKLAAEIMEELPEDEVVQLSDPNPRATTDDKDHVCMYDHGKLGGLSKVWYTYMKFLVV